jgi:parvulin-like peptidyl-prolyl isomerase
MYMKRLLSFFLLSTLITVTGFAQMDLQPAAIVRLTKSEPITVKQLKTEVERMEQQSGRALTTAERREVLDVMINERLAIQAAERDKVTVSDGEVNQQIQQLRASMAEQVGRQPTDAEFAAAIRSETGLELAAFREQIRRQFLVQKYLMAKKQSILDSAKAPTEAEIINAYNLNKAQFVRPDTVRFSLIQVTFGDAAADKTKAREVADRLVRDIGSSPSKFDEMVVKSQSPNSGYQAGDGGYLPRNAQAQQVVGAEFLNTAFNLKQGEVSRLIETPRAFSIIKVIETYDQKSLVLDDIFQLGTRMTVRDYIGNAMLQERQQAVIDKATQELVTELRAGNTFQIYDNNISW